MGNKRIQVPRPCTSKSKDCLPYKLTVLLSLSCGFAYPETLSACLSNSVIHSHSPRSHQGPVHHSSATTREDFLLREALLESVCFLVHHFNANHHKVLPQHFSHNPLVSCLSVFPISSALKGWHWMHVFPYALCWTEMFTESVPPFLPPSLPFLLSSPYSPFPLSFLHSFSTLSPSFYPSFFYSLII